MQNCLRVTGGRRHGMASIIAIATLVHATGLRAQVTRPDTVPDRELFHRSDLVAAAGFGGVTVLMFPLDRHLASVVRDEDFAGNQTLRSAASGFRFLGGPGPLVAGPLAYAIGRLAHAPRVSELALHSTEALLVGGAVTSVLKVVIGRERPYVSGDTNPHHFRLFDGGGGGDFASFPSGHTTAAFSVAAAIVAESNEWWPKSTRYVAPIMYLGAAGVGLSRMYDDKHWASDVVMGAAIGTFAGLKTVRFNHTHTGNRLDRWLLGHVLVVPQGDGVWVAFSATPAALTAPPPRSAR